MYLDLLNPDSTAFFQHPNKTKTGYTREVIGKKPLGEMMKEISSKAKLSHVYTNQQICKTTATGMHQEGFSLQEIANVTKHKNLDSLKHYVATLTLHDKQRYNEGLFSYGNPNNKRKSTENEPSTSMKVTRNKENLPQEMPLTVQDTNDTPNSSIGMCAEMNSVVNNDLRRAPNLFHNATFTNCNFNFMLPQ